jgi:hypothetical protein
VLHGEFPAVRAFSHGFHAAIDQLIHRRHVSIAPRAVFVPVEK